MYFSAVLLIQVDWEEGKVQESEQNFSRSFIALGQGFVISIRRVALEVFQCKVEYVFQTLE